MIAAQQHQRELSVEHIDQCLDLPVGGGACDTLRIANVGTGVLEWSLIEMPTGSVAPAGRDGALDTDPRLAEVRATLDRLMAARRSVSAGSRSVVETAYLLGFSEASSFSRAYKGWTGQAPSEARRNLA